MRTRDLKKLAERYRLEIEMQEDIVYEICCSDKHDLHMLVEMRRDLILIESEIEYRERKRRYGLVLHHDLTTAQGDEVFDFIADDKAGCQ